MTASIICTNCHEPYPAKGTPYRCSICGGIYDFKEFPGFDPAQVRPELPGIWRYRHAFGLPDEAPVISLGEGQTPLVWTEYQGKPVGVKCEFQNPTGSFKDRGSALLVSLLRSRQVRQAVEDSSGNAGASYAAYAARAGIEARVYVPDSASGPKRTQIEAYGASLVSIMGPRSNAAEAVLKAADSGMAYASHAYLPFNLPGYATAAYELVEQNGGAPGSVILPVGQGGLLLGMLRGFRTIKQAGIITQVPKMIGVQARACAPIWAISAYGPTGLSLVSEGDTLAEGIRVRHPLRGDVVLQEVDRQGGQFLAVDEDEIISSRDELAGRGFYVENTSAVAWAAMRQLAKQDSVLPEPVILMLTGSGLKNKF